MYCRLDLKSDPFRLVIVGATTLDHKAMEDLGDNGFINVEIVDNKRSNYTKALSDLNNWMGDNWGKEGWSPDSLQEIVMRLNATRGPARKRKAKK